MMFALLAWVGADAASMPSSSRFLANPDTGRSLLQRTADFWKGYRDDGNGGYNAVVSASGRGSGDTKYFSPQSRLAYVFTRAFMVTGDTTYLNHAEHALEFLYAHAWDPSGIGGWFYQAQSDGTFPLPDSTRWSYMQHYALLGPTVFWERPMEARNSRGRTVRSPMRIGFGGDPSGSSATCGTPRPAARATSPIGIPPVRSERGSPRRWTESPPTARRWR
ncbi:MAG TPA: hypothetical protein PKY05_11855 [Fibrobacteria bacterium]|nr:hypothetical protein [Fibrobacteria bacterium]